MDSGIRKFLRLFCKWLGIILGTLFVLLILLPMFSFVWPVELLWTMASGWFTHIVRMLRELSWDIGAIALSLTALLVAVVSLHYIITSLKKEKGTWRWKNTVGASGAVLLLCGMAIAVSGVIHQLAWLAREPVTERSGISDSTRITMSLKDMYVGLHDYQVELGKPAASIEEMLVARGQDGVGFHMLMKPILKRGDSLVYYGSPVNGREILIAHTSSPAYSGGWVCLLADGSTPVISDPRRLEVLIAKTREHLRSLTEEVSAESSEMKRDEAVSGRPSPSALSLPNGLKPEDIEWPSEEGE